MTEPHGLPTSKQFRVLSPRLPRTCTQISPRAQISEGPNLHEESLGMGPVGLGLGRFNAIVTTFVFSVYLVNSDLFGPAANQRLGYVLAGAGLIVAVIAPVLGQSGPLKSASVMRITTLLTALITACLFFVSPGETQLGSASSCWLRATSRSNPARLCTTQSLPTSPHHRTSGVSGFGWGLGYLGEHRSPAHLVRWFH